MNGRASPPPRSARVFRGQRWLKISLRTLHLLGTAGAGGGYLYGAPADAWLPWLWLTVTSGAALVGIEIWSDPGWLIQVSGLAILAKLALLGAAAHLPALAGWLLAAVIIISGVISHAPARVRHYSILHRRRIDRPRPFRPD